MKSTGVQKNSHHEEHLGSSAFITDMVIGMSDGLTVPFALAAGLSGAVSSNAVVITAGIAEIVAGSIAMGLGAESYPDRHRRCFSCFPGGKGIQYNFLTQIRKKKPVLFQWTKPQTCHPNPTSVPSPATASSPPPSGCIPLLEV